MTKGTKAFRIIISILLALCICATVILFVETYYHSMVVINQEEYGLVVAGVVVTRENEDDILGDGTVSYDPFYNILYFENAEIESDQSIVATVKDIGICLVGENRFISSSSGYMPLIYAVDSFLDKDIYIFGDGSLTIEYLNACADSSIIQCADLTILSDITISTPDCTNISNGIVCDSSFKLFNGATITINSGVSKSVAAFRVRGNAILEAGTAINITVKEGSEECAKGISVNGDLIIGDGASVNVSVEEDSATLVECVRVNGLIDVGAGAALTASTAKSYAVECYGAIKLCDNAVLSAASEDSEADVICYGAVANYGADVNGEIEALGQIYDKSEK